MSRLYKYYTLRTGKVVSAPTPPSGEPVGDRSISFPGTSGVFAATAVNASSVINTSTNTGWYRLWFYRLNGSPTAFRDCLLGCTNTGWSGGFAAGNTNVANQLRVWLHAWNSANIINFTLPAIGSWNHLVVTFQDGNVLKAKLNGGAVQSVACGTGTIPSSVMRLGSSQLTVNSGEFRGYQNNYGFGNTLLSDADMNALYNGGVPINALDVVPGATQLFSITQADTVTAAGGIADTGSLATPANGNASLSLSTEVPS